jgi:hypothetical protein
MTWGQIFGDRTCFGHVLLFDDLDIKDYIRLAVCSRSLFFAIFAQTKVHAKINCTHELYLFFGRFHHINQQIETDWYVCHHYLNFWLPYITKNDMILGCRDFAVQRDQLQWQILSTLIKRHRKKIKPPQERIAKPSKESNLRSLQNLKIQNCIRSMKRSKIRKVVNVTRVHKKYSRSFR